MIISLSGYAGSGKDTAGKIIQWLAYSEGEHASWEERTLEQWFRVPAHIAAEASGCRIKKWADALRRVAHIFLPQFTLEFLYTDEFKQMELEGWDYETQQVELDEQGQDHVVVKTMTGRQFLQWLGTDAIRNSLHRDAWVKALMSEYQPKMSSDRYMGTTDPCSICGKTLREQAKGCNEITCYRGRRGGIVTTYPNWIITDTRFPNELKAVKAAGGYTIRLQRLPEWLKEMSAEQVLAWQDSLHESETALDNARFDFTVDNNGSLDELTAQLQQIMTQITHNEQGRQTDIYPVKRAG